MHIHGNSQPRAVGSACSRFSIRARDASIVMREARWSTLLHHRGDCGSVCWTGAQLQPDVVDLPLLLRSNQSARPQEHASMGEPLARLALRLECDACDTCLDSDNTRRSCQQSGSCSELLPGIAGSLLHAGRSWTRRPCHRTFPHRARHRCKC